MELGGHADTLAGMPTGAQGGILSNSEMRPAGLPPGPSYPAAIQAVGFWTRPFAFLRQCRERYGKRFTIKLPGAPPFVMLTDPAEVKEVFTAPPDVLRPGEGARVIEPVVGSNSVLLLDEAAHMEQRKLMLPAFHPFQDLEGAVISRHDQVRR